MTHRSDTRNTVHALRLRAVVMIDVREFIRIPGLAVEDWLV